MGKGNLTGYIYRTTTHRSQTAHDMEAKEFQYHSDHIPQAVLDQVWDQVKQEQDQPLDLSGTTRATAIVISDSPPASPGSQDEDNNYDSVDLMTDESWDEFFVAGEGPSAAMAIPVAEATSDACVGCARGNGSLLSDAMGCERATLQNHGLRIWSKSPHLSCTKCSRLTDGCLTDRQIRYVSFALMPGLYKSINEKNLTDMERMVHLRMIVRLYGLTNDGIDKIGHCLLEELTGLDIEDRHVVIRIEGNYE